MSQKSVKAALGAAAVLVLCQSAGAHPGHGLQSGFAAGVAHPFSGRDHILAMTAVGFYAARLGGKALWLLPAAFLVSMIAGGTLAADYAGHVPWVEQAIAASVLILGLLLAAKSNPPMPVVLGLIGLFALFHGYAHGTEMQAGLAPENYAMGFTLATAILISIGLGAGLLLKQRSQLALTRIAGMAMAVCGLILFWI